MKRLTLVLFATLLTACSTTLPHFTKQQDQQSKVLSVLADYTGDVLAAAAMPLQYYCHHSAWPKQGDLNTTQKLVSNLSGLTYSKRNKNAYQANFSLLDRAPGNENALTNWTVVIPTINPLLKTIQHVKLQITNKNNHIKLLSIMDFKCMQDKGSDNVNTLQSNNFNGS